MSIPFFFEGIQQVALFFSFLAQAVALGLLFIEQLFLLLISHLQIDAFFRVVLVSDVFLRPAYAETWCIHSGSEYGDSFGRGLRPKNKHQLIVYFEPGMKLFY